MCVCVVFGFGRPEEISRQNIMRISAKNLETRAHVMQNVFYDDTCQEKKKKETPDNGQTNNWSARPER